ncbi:MAG: biotin--[acetyl-CoA-carboxylase] ligase [Oscillospiraceae bacterium]|nr:biotin--[acetyl-CoA-carboxylase] ligase [Oscillospiraceae bacterium]
MTKDAVLDLLRGAEGFVSGQEMSRRLAVSRAAVWKAVQTLREEGYAIESATNRGYRLAPGTGPLRAEALRRRLGDCPWADRVTVLASVDSTNNALRQLADQGAPHGTVVIAEQQTAGKGRLGRRFASPAGVGLYLSVLLRLNAPPMALMHLTAAAAEAAVEAVEAAAGIRPGIKWTNDLVLNRRKCAGILTELSLQAESGLVDYAIVGIGTNCNHSGGDFPEEVRPMAISLREAAGRPVDRCAYAAALIGQLWRMDAELLTEKKAWMTRYAADCITVGQDVKVVRGRTERPAHADGLDENAALLVTYEDGTKEAVTSGEVSVRGMYGYL